MWVSCALQLAQGADLTEQLGAQRLHVVLQAFSLALLALYLLLEDLGAGPRRAQRFFILLIHGHLSDSHLARLLPLILVYFVDSFLLLHFLQSSLIVKDLEAAAGHRSLIHLKCLVDVVISGRSEVAHVTCHS